MFTVSSSRYAPIKPSSMFCTTRSTPHSATTCKTSRALCPSLSRAISRWRFPPESRSHPRSPATIDLRTPLISRIRLHTDLQQTIAELPDPTRRRARGQNHFTPRGREAHVSTRLAGRLVADVTPRVVKRPRAASAFRCPSTDGGFGGRRARKWGYFCLTG